MRITSGDLRGRVLKTPEGSNTRPTTDKVRQALFNMLRAHSKDLAFKEAVVLDAFAGSGALGFEAISQGVQHVSFFDKDYQALSIVKENADLLKCREQCSFKKNDITRYDFSHCSEPFDLIFLDPPYGKGLVVKTLDHLQQYHVIKDGAFIVIEMDGDQEEVLPDYLSEVTAKRYGRIAIKLCLYQK